MDPHLHKCVFGRGKEEIEEVTWEKLYGGIQSKMNPAYSIEFPGQSRPHIKKVYIISLSRRFEKMFLRKFLDNLFTLSLGQIT